MQAVRPVFNSPPPEAHCDLDMGAGQEEFITLPVTAIIRGTEQRPYFVSCARWRLTDEERAAIANGADIVHQVIHTPGAYPPMNLQIVAKDEDAVIVRS